MKQDKELLGDPFGIGSRASTEPAPQSPPSASIPIAMDAKTLRALKGSIKKWEKIVAGNGDDKGPNNCPLCKLFFDAGCQNCPVAAQTEQDLCYGTPYELWLKDATFDHDLGTYVIGNKRSRLYAELEVTFLKSLLPAAPERCAPTSSSADAPKE